MKMRLLAGLLVLLAAAPAAAQGPIYANIDIPNVAGTAIYGPGFYIAGWALDCASGMNPASIALIDTDLLRETVQWMPASWIGGLARPDVQRVMNGTCPGTTLGTGYALVPLVDLEPGWHVLTVMYHDWHGHYAIQSVLVLAD
jgi:hypothetical protein